MEAGHGGVSEMKIKKSLMHHGFTVNSLTSSNELRSTGTFRVNFEIHGRYNSSMLDNTIYSSLLHVIRKRVEMLSVSNIKKVANPG